MACQCSHKRGYRTKLPDHCFWRQNSFPGLTDVVPRLRSVTLRIRKPISSSRLCQIRQTIKSKGWQENRPLCPGSPRPQCPAQGGPLMAELLQLRLRPALCRGKEKEGKAPSPYSRSACYNHHRFAAPGAQAPKAKLPPELFAFPLTPPLAPAVPLSPTQSPRLGPARREVWSAAWAGASLSPHPPG